MTNSKKYQVIIYMLVDPENPTPLTYEQALQDKKQLELMQPENIYRIEDDVLEYPGGQNEYYKNRVVRYNY